MFPNFMGAADDGRIEAILAEHGVPLIENVDPLARLAMACPALPLCGLAITEAERIMPSYVERIRILLNKLDMGSEEIMMRMTGCPNGCARPYMAELAFVGEGITTYQLWVGGSPVLDGRTGWAYKSKVGTVLQFGQRLHLQRLRQLGQRVHF